MLGLYPNNMKAICSRGIQDNVRPGEINKKAEHNDRAPKNSYITPLSLLTVWDPDTWNEKLHLYSAQPAGDTVKTMVCPLTFSTSVWIQLVINVISGHDILILVLPPQNDKLQVFLFVCVCVCGGCVYAWFQLGYVSRAALTDVLL